MSNLLAVSILSKLIAPKESGKQKMDLVFDEDPKWVKWRRIEPKVIGYGSIARVELIRERHPPIVAKYLTNLDASKRWKFDEEWKALKGLQHPNVVYYYGWNGDHNYFTLFMEYCERKSLNATLENPNVIYNMKTVICWAEHLLSALFFLSKRQILHRDIKVTNCLLTNDFTLKVSDFGCTKDLSEMGSGKEYQAATSQCLSPEAYLLSYQKDLGNEQIAQELFGVQINAQSDLYSAGLVLCEIIERTETFSQYDNGTWENQRFQKDLLTLKAVLPTPNCKHRIAQLVDSCTKMRQTERATIDSIYPQIVHLNLEYQKFPFFPLICEKQKQLLRPIGFDNRLTKAVVSRRFNFSSEISKEQTEEILLPDSWTSFVGETATELFLGCGGFGGVKSVPNHHPVIAAKYIDYDSRLPMNELFEKERETLKRLPHPNIVHFFDLKLDKTNMVIYMEFCERGSLFDVLYRSPSVIYNMKTVLCWAEHLFAGLLCLFENEIIHRDIKPRNVLVTKDFVLKLGDFGCMKDLNATKPLNEAKTLRYASPEALGFFDGNHMESPQSDIYQIGLVLWEIVERRTVYEDYGETEMNLDRFLFDCRKNSVKLNSPDSLHPIREIIETCTKIDCKERSSALTHHKLVMEYNQDYGRFEMDPLIRETQERLIRPIGFDGTENEVNVDNREGVDVNSSFLPPGIFISGASTLNEY